MEAAAWRDRHQRNYFRDTSSDRTLVSLPRAVGVPVHDVSRVGRSHSQYRRAFDGARQRRSVAQPTRDARHLADAPPRRPLLRQLPPRASPADGSPVLQPPTRPSDIARKRLQPPNGNPTRLRRSPSASNLEAGAVATTSRRVACLVSDFLPRSF